MRTAVAVFLLAFASLDASAVGEGERWLNALRQMVGEMICSDPRSQNADTRSFSLGRYKALEERLAAVKTIDVATIHSIAMEHRFGPARVMAWGQALGQGAFFAYARSFSEEGGDPSACSPFLVNQPPPNRSPRLSDGFDPNLN